MASFAKGLEDQVTCSICLQSYTDPRVLPCLHTYCTHCLENLILKTGTKNVVVCPDCRAESQISDGDVSKLKVNFWINNLLSVLSLKSEDKSQKLVCGLCVSQDEAHGRCAECCEFMCEFCITAHRRTRATQQHAIISLEDIKRAGMPVAKKPSPCPKHQEALKLFCDTCKELICRDCTIVEHRGHEYLFTCDVGEREKNAIMALVQTTKKRTAEVEAALASVQKEQRRLDAQTKQVLKEANLFIDEQISKLKSTSKNLAHDINKIKSDRSKQLAAQTDQLQLLLASINSSVDFADRVCREGNDNDVLSIRNEVTTRLTHLAAVPFQGKPRVHSNVKLQVNSDYWQSMADNVGIDCCEDPGFNNDGARYNPNAGTNAGLTTFHGQPAWGGYQAQQGYASVNEHIWEGAYMGYNASGSDRRNRRQ